MKKTKICVLFLAISLLINTNISFSADSNTAPRHPELVSGSSQTDSKIYKETIEDQRLEYINKDWWDKFHDPILKGYILKAVKDNYDLKIATLKTSEAQAAVRESLGKEFPTIGTNSSFLRGRYSGTVLESYPISMSNYTFPLTANYELDLWRKNREATIGTAKALEAAKYDEKAVYISLCSSVAAAYFNVINTDKKIQLQKDIVELRKNIYDLTKDNNKYGLVPTLDVIIADRDLTEAQSDLNDFEKQRILFLNQLATLVGESSVNSVSIKRISFDDIELMKDLPMSIESKVVLDRPDILKAEAELQKSRIDVSLARKDFFPDITIAGAYGFNSSFLAHSFDWNSYIASIGVNLAQGIFAGGQKVAKLKGKKYQYQEMFENYHKTILNSFQEVNDSLASLKYDTKKNNEYLERIDLEKANYDLINNQYAYGEISYLDTIQYKERILSLEKDQTQSKTDSLIDSLSLYKAVGGKL